VCLGRHLHTRSATARIESGGQGCVSPDRRPGIVTVFYGVGQGSALPACGPAAKPLRQACKETAATVSARRITVKNNPCNFRWHACFRALLHTLDSQKTCLGLGVKSSAECAKTIANKGDCRFTPFATIFLFAYNTKSRSKQGAWIKYNGQCASLIFSHTLAF
jgi:hypothetical protein